MVTKSTTPASRDKQGRPEKPYDDFPLFPHRTGRWCKKVKGRSHYFGKIADDPKGEKALDLWLNQRDDLMAGRKPRQVSTGVTVRELVNKFLTAKKLLVDSGELTPRSWKDYFYTGGRIIEGLTKERAVVDLRSDDFERLRTKLAKTLGPVALGNEIQRTRTIFKYAVDEQLIDRPLHFGQSFKKPSRKTLRIARAKAGPRMFEADELRKIITAAGVPLKAMILLGVNLGYGQSDISSLPIAALNLKTGWADFPRVKTGVERRAKLWPETIAAVKAAIAARPTPKDQADEKLMFITKYGRRWVRVYGDGTPDDAVGKEFAKLLVELGMKRPGASFYSLRRNTETIGGACRDQVAINAVMGHVDDSMAARYRERIDDERLEAVASYIHEWLWPPKKSKGPSPTTNKAKGGRRKAPARA